jgi:serine/threonine protein kinase/ketosteroid isomerase-like protein
MKVCASCNRCYEDVYSICANDKSELGTSPPASPFIAKKYRLDWLLGQGRLGIVFEGTILETERRVAIKLILPDLADHPGNLKQFRTEAYAVAHLNTRIDQQHVVKTYDYGTLNDGTPYFVMELVEGQPLSELLQRRGQISVTDVVDIARQITDGLEAAHRAGVVHGNLRLSNTFVSRDRHNRIEVKILDFGFARMRSLLSTHSSEQGGVGSRSDTQHYIAPEQRRGRRPDERSDVYSLGVILYELLAGGPIVTGKIPIEEISLSGDLRPLREMREDVSESLWQLIKQSLDEKPTERPWSAAVFARQLYNIARSELPFYAAEIELRAKIIEPQPAVESVSLSAVEPVCASIASDLVMEEIAPAEPAKKVESPQPIPVLDSLQPSSTHEWVDDIEAASLASDEVEPYIEEEGWELEQVDRVLTGTLPASHTKTRASTSSLRAALSSIPVVLTGTASRLNSPTTRRAFVALTLSVVAIAAGAMIVYLLSSARSYVSQAKSSITTNRPLPKIVQSEQVQPAAVSVPPSASSQPAPLSVPAARPSAAPQDNPSPAENIPAGLKEQTAESAADVQGEEQALRAVFDRWLTATNNRDVDSQMDLYLDKIDTFYRSRHTSLDDVREHKSKVYSGASSIDMRASEPEIKIDDDGQKATMRFRKEWVIKGKSSSRGRATQELKLAKTEDGWKITGERNVSGSGG